MRKLVIPTPCDYIALCSFCGAHLTVEGGVKVGGYRLPNHPHSDITRAAQGENCPGSATFAHNILAGVAGEESFTVR